MRAWWRSGSLLTGHFRVFISTLCNSAVRGAALRTGCRIAVRIRTSHQPSGAEHRVGSLPQRSHNLFSGLQFQASIVCPGHASRRCALCRQGDTSHRKHPTRSRLTFPYKRSISASFPEPVSSLYTSRSTTRDDLGVHRSVSKVPVPFATLQVRASVKRCDHGRIVDPIGDFDLARNKGGASDLNVRRGL